MTMKLTIFLVLSALLLTTQPVVKASKSACTTWKETKGAAIGTVAGVATTKLVTAAGSAVGYSWAIGAGTASGVAAKILSGTATGLAYSAGILGTVGLSAVAVPAGVLVGVVAGLSYLSVADEC